MAVTINGSTGISGVDGSASVPSLQGVDGDTGLYFPTADEVAISTNGSQRVTIDSSGRLLVGTSSNLTPGYQVQVAGTNNATSSLSLHRFQDSDGSSILEFLKSRGSTVGTDTIVNDGDFLGRINFSGYDGTGYYDGARIESEVDGTPGANDMPGRLVFSTTADGASSPTEQLRITSDGYIRLSSDASGIQFNSDTSADNALNDYEEGTWTPVISDASSGGNTATVVVNEGTYTKVGRLVIARMGTTNIDTTGMTAGNNFFVQGLPFTSVNVGASIVFHHGPVVCSSVTLPYPITAEIVDNANYLRLAETVTGSARDFVTVSQIISGSSDVFLTLTYEAAS